LPDGTAIGTALALALAQLKDLPANASTIVLVTDGANNTGKPTPFVAAEAARALGIRIHTIGVSSADTTGPNRRFIWRWGGRQADRLTGTDEAILKRIADRSGGRFDILRNHVGGRRPDIEASEAVENHGYSVQPRRPERFRVGAFPVFNMEAPEGRFYGFPIHGIPGFKIGKYHHREQQVDPDSIDRDCDTSDEAVVREGIRRYFPDADGPTLSMATCMFTNTPDEHFILDLHPDSRQVSIAAGFSGHGFKFCSVVGEIMADLATEGTTRFDVELFRLARPPLRAPAARPR